MSFGQATRQVLLRPVGGPQADGTQLYDVVDKDVNPWNATAEYALGQHTVGPDGKVYISKVNRNKGNNPVGDLAAHWASLVG